MLKFFNFELYCCHWIASSSKYLRFPGFFTLFVFFFFFSLLAVWGYGCCLGHHSGGVLKSMISLWSRPPFSFSFVLFSFFFFFFWCLPLYRVAWHMILWWLNWNGFYVHKCRVLIGKIYLCQETHPLGETVCCGARFTAESHHWECLLEVFRLGLPIKKKSELWWFQGM